MCQVHSRDIGRQRLDCSICTTTKSVGRKEINIQKLQAQMYFPCFEHINTRTPSFLLVSCTNLRCFLDVQQKLEWGNGKDLNSSALFFARHHRQLVSFLCGVWCYHCLDRSDPCTCSLGVEERQENLSQSPTTKNNFLGFRTQRTGLSNWVLF